MSAAPHGGGRGRLAALCAWVLARSGWVLLVTIGISVAALWVLPRLEFDVSVESFLDADDPDMQIVDEVVSRFGSGVPLILAYRDPDLFTVRGLARLDALTRRIADIDYVASAHSLTSASVVHGDADSVSVRPLVDRLPTTDAEARAVGAAAREERNIIGNLLSADGEVAAVVVKMVYVAGHDDEYAPEVVHGVIRAAKEILPPQLEFHTAGLAVFYEQMVAYARRDLGVLIVVPLVLVFVLLVLLMRSGPGVVLPLVVVSLTMLWTLGLMAALGETLSIASILLPPLVLVIGCADGVHIINQTSEEAAEHPGAAHRATLINAMNRVGLAVLVTSATTSVGFGSLAVSGVRTVRQFGLYAAVAVVIALALSLTLIPVLLQWWPVPPRRPAAAGKRRWIERALRRVGRFNEARPRTVLLAWLIASAVLIAGIVRIRVETGFRDNFTADSPITASLEFVQAHLSGPDLLSVYVRGEGPDAILEPRVLRFIDQIAAQLRRDDAVRQVDSIVDVLSDARHVLDGDTPAGTYLPETRAEAAQLLLLVETEEDYLAPLLTPERDAARLSARFDAIPTSRAAAIVAALDAQIAASAVPGVEAHILGPVYITQRLVNEVIDSQIRSFALAFVLIFLMMAATLRSVPLAAISMIPNILPIGIMLGVMGFADLPLNDVTIMTASIAIGIAVDDTIHYLVRFRGELGGGGGVHGAMARTIDSVGRAIVITSVVLAVGFAVSMLASFKPPIYFGILSVVTIVVALAADLSLLPVLLLVIPLRLTRGGSAARRAP